jgi:hypothetical protein
MGRQSELTIENKLRIQDNTEAYLDLRRTIMGICKHAQYRNSTKIAKQNTLYYNQRTVVRPKQATAYRPGHLPST